MVLRPLPRCYRRVSVEQLGGNFKQFDHRNLSSVKGQVVFLFTFDYLAFMWGGVPRILQRARALREPRVLTFEIGTASTHELDG